MRPRRTAVLRRSSVALSRRRASTPAAAHARPSRGVADLWAAHRELSQLEWLELKQSLTAAAGWAALALLGGLGAWLALNAALLFAFGGSPLRAGAVVAVNLALAALGGLRARRLLRRPLFPLTRIEVARDVHTLVEVIA